MFSFFLPAGPREAPAERDSTQREAALAQIRGNSLKLMSPLQSDQSDSSALEVLLTPAPLLASESGLRQQ